MDGAVARFRVRPGSFETTLEERLPAVAEDRLFLVSASSVVPFRPVYDALTEMGFYNLSPAAIRQMQPPDPGTLLRRDGGNLASVLGHLAAQNPAALERIVEYLRLVSPGVEAVSKVSAGPMETIEFRQKVSGQSKPWRFAAAEVEYEAWFLASAESLRGHRGLPDDLDPPDHPESVTDAKGWLRTRRTDGQSDSPSVDQPALTSVFDLSLARTRSPSFDKLWRDVERLMGAG